MASAAIVSRPAGLPNARLKCLFDATITFSPEPTRAGQTTAAQDITSPGHQIMEFVRPKLILSGRKEVVAVLLFGNASRAHGTIPTHERDAECLPILANCIEPKLRIRHAGTHRRFVQ